VSPRSFQNTLYLSVCLFLTWLCFFITVCLSIDVTCIKDAIARAAVSVDWLLALRRTSVTRSRLDDFVNDVAFSNFVVITLGPTEPKIWKTNAKSCNYIWAFVHQQLWYDQTVMSFVDIYETLIALRSLNKSVIIICVELGKQAYPLKKDDFIYMTFLLYKTMEASRIVSLPFRFRWEDATATDSRRKVSSGGQDPKALARRVGVSGSRGSGFHRPRTVLDLTWTRTPRRSDTFSWYSWWSIKLSLSLQNHFPELSVNVEWEQRRVCLFVILCFLLTLLACFHSSHILKKTQLKYI